MASRHLSRTAALQALFAADVRGALTAEMVLATWRKNTDSLAHDDEDRAFTESLIKGILAKREELNRIIEKSAPQWPLNKIAAIDRNVLRIGLFELLFGEVISVPPKVALNEAIELAKSFGGDSSGKFVNGVLGSVYREMGSPRKDEALRSTAEAYSAGTIVCAVHSGVVFIALVLDPFGKWTVPKVRMKPGELTDGAARRAVQEELGMLHVIFHGSLGEHRYEAHLPGEGIAVRAVGYFVACAAKNKLAPKKDAIQDARWFSLSELDTIPLYDDLRPMIELAVVKAKEVCS